MIGQKLGRYRILGKLGQGGLATVWRAEDELLRRIVAIKVLDSRLAASPDVVRRFQHEGQSTAALSHPGIVAVFDWGTEAGTPYLVLECLQGEVLADRIRRALLPIPEAVRIGRDVADALRFAHQHGVIHRDVTARNVMLTSERRTVVLDFGLALAAWESRLTATGANMGTLGYIAPELLRGLDADRRSDEYGLGILLYEMLTGSTPFATNNPVALVHRSLHEDPAPPSSRRADIPPELDAVVLRAIARDREDRFPDLGEFAAALRQPAGKRATSIASKPEIRIEDSRRPDPLYLAVAPFRARPGDELAARLEFALRALLSKSSNVRLVVLPEEADAGLRDVARTSGANALLETALDRDGSRVRLRFTAVNVIGGVQFAGDQLEGTVQAPFDLEDEFVASVRRALHIDDAATLERIPGRAPDPAREEILQQALFSLRRHDSIAMVDGAIRLLTDLVTAEPDSARLQAALGRACLYKYRLTKLRTWEARAAQAIERAVECDPDSAFVYLALGELHVETGAQAVAIAEFDRVDASDPGNVEAAIGRARAHLAMGNAAAAERDARAALLVDDSDWRSWNILGEVLHHENRPAEALEAWQRVVEQTPDNAVAHRNVGTCLYRLNRFEEATGAYRRSLAIQPTALSFTNLGTVLFFCRKSGEAAEAFRKAANLRPADPLLWGNLGNACRWIEGREEEAAEALDRAIALAAERLARNESDFELWARSAEWLAGRGRADEARAAISRALAIAPDEFDVILRAAHVHVDLGEFDEAVRRLGHLVERGYPTAELRSSMALHPLHGHPGFDRLIAS